MFVSKSKNRSGSISVRVMEKRRGRNVVVKSFGASKDEGEVGRMVSAAEEYVKRQTGRFYTLFNPVPQVSIGDFLASLSNSQVSVIGPELIFGRLYDRIGFGEIGDEMFRHLVISRLASPGSKLYTADYLLRYRGVSCDVNRIYRHLDKLCLRRPDIAGTSGLKDAVERVTYRHCLSAGGGAVDVVFYDITTLYFEASREDDLRRLGYSKDGKADCPQILLGLLVTRSGFPVSYEVFEGNLCEQRTFVPLLRRAEQKFGLGRPVVVADAGLLSKANIEALSSEGYGYILGARLRNESAQIQERILSMNLEDGDVRAIRKDDGTRIVVSRTEKRRRKDAHNRERGLERLRRRVASGRLGKKDINNRGYNKYLRLSGQMTVSIDMEAYDRDAQWDGIKGYVTNTALPDKEVISQYASLWMIERAFRMNKTDLRVRPIYHRLRNRIEGHICICFTAYVIQLELARMLKAAGSDITVNRAREIVRNMYRIRYTLPGRSTESEVILRMDDEQQELYDLVTDWVHR